jgi:hypothetical protein
MKTAQISLRKCKHPHRAAVGGEPRSPTPARFYSHQRAPQGRSDCQICHSVIWQPGATFGVCARLYFPKPGRAWPRRRSYGP